MARLTFPVSALATMVAQAEKNWPNGHNDLYGQKTGEGFWLVGDRGIYLMSNAKNGDEKALVAYANECNPDTMSNDLLYDRKRALFGGDDGAEYLNILPTLKIALRENRDLIVSLSAARIKFTLA